MNFPDKLPVLTKFSLKQSVTLETLQTIHFFIPSGDVFALFVSTCLITLSVIYIFNFFGKMFLGDGGSYLISFVAGIILIKFSNDNSSVSPYFIMA